MPQQYEEKYALFGVMLVVLVFIIYSNTFHSPWILDDFHNIVDNPRIQIESLSLKNIKGSLFSFSKGYEKLYRPLPCLTFALNAYFGGKNVFGYHLVNISLHAATALMLMRLLILVFKTPAFLKTPDKEKQHIILLATVLWAVNPIQIQAVTYIVQRMAALCTFFALTALGFYIKARISKYPLQKSVSYLFCVIGTICAFLSKENGILIIPLILTLEYFLFGNGDYKIFIKKEVIAIFLFICLLASCFLFYSVSLQQLADLYDERPFSLYERFVTQPKILLFYLSLIFYPLPYRFSLEHEVLISSGIFSPPETILCIALVAVSFIACVISKKIPFLARIGVVFYFIAHGIESSLLPLEMVFEHRNYLPSIFLFPPVAAGLYRLLGYYNDRRLIKYAINLFIFSIIFLNSLATYTRNFDWKSGEKLWMDAMLKAPGHARPKQSMGFVIGMKNPEKALKYYALGLSGYMHEPREEKASTLTNMGLIYFHQKRYEEARILFEQAIKIDKKFRIAIYFLVQTHMHRGAWKTAIEIINENSNIENLLRLKAICFLYTGDYQQALNLFSILFRQNSENGNNLLNLAEAFSMAGYYKKANFFYNLYHSQYPQNPTLYIRMAKNHYLNDNLQEASKCLSIFFKMSGIENMEKQLRQLSKDILLPMADIQKMEPFIADEFKKYSAVFCSHEFLSL